MVWTHDITPGKGYTWGGVDSWEGGKGDYYSEINPQRRAMYEAQAPGRSKYGWSWNQPRGRGDIDPKYWVKPGPSYDERSGYATNIGRNFANPGGTGAGIDATAPGREFIMRTGAADEDEIDKKRREFDHSMWSHVRLPSMDILGKVGNLFEGAMRGSRLHGAYKDRAVAAGLSKAQGSKMWEADKRKMMRGYGLEEGDPGYKDSDQAFYDKYMNLASMTDDSVKRQEYLDQAETAWRNAQTSNRLAAATGFEGYMPDYYKRPGRGHDIMNEIAANLGQGIWYPGEASPRSTAEGRDAIASQMNIPEDDITSAIQYGDPNPEGDILYGEPTGFSYAEPDPEGDLLYGEPFKEPPGGYLDVSDTLPSRRPKGYGLPLGAFIGSLFQGDEPVGGYPKQDLSFLEEEDLRRISNHPMFKNR